MPARVAALRPDELTAEQRSLYERLTTGRRATGPRPFPLTDDEGRLQGPFNAMLFSPELGDALQNLGDAVRYATGFTARQREIATLTVAAHEDSAYEWAVHGHVGRQAGLTEAELTALRTGADHTFADPAEDAIRTATRELLTTGDLTDAAFAHAREILGLTRLYELITLVGYYRLLAVQLRALRVPG